MSFSPVPKEIKSLVNNYLKVAEEYEDKDLTVTYWCRMAAYHTADAVPLCRKTHEIKHFINKLHEWLEITKENREDIEGIINVPCGEERITEYAFNLYKQGQQLDDAMICDITTVRLFFTAGVLMDVLGQFGAITDNVKEKREHAKRRATHINRGLVEAEARAAQARSPKRSPPKRPTQHAETRAKKHAEPHAKTTTKQPEPQATTATVQSLKLTAEELALYKYKGPLLPTIREPEASTSQSDISVASSSRTYVVFRPPRTIRDMPVEPREQPEEPAEVIEPKEPEELQEIQELYQIQERHALEDIHERQQLEEIQEPQEVEEIQERQLLEEIQQHQQLEEIQERQQLEEVQEDQELGEIQERQELNNIEELEELEVIEELQELGEIPERRELEDIEELDELEENQERQELDDIQERQELVEPVEIVEVLPSTSTSSTQEADSIHFEYFAAAHRLCKAAEAALDNRDTQGAIIHLKKALDLLQYGREQ